MIFIAYFIVAYFAAFNTAQRRTPKLEQFKSIDAFKKHLRTKTNVLVYYTRSSLTDEHNADVLQLLSDVAQDMYGKATVGYVDCQNDEGRKICKKMKVLIPDDKHYVLYHFGNGKFTKEYDRALSRGSLKRFLENPTADLPWEDESDPSDVVHVTDSKTWKNMLSKETLPILAMFYAPWCGYCKRLKPSYSAAASEMRKKTILAALDVTKPELYDLQKLYNISGFPTLLYFENGQLKFPFGGEQTKEGIIKWLQNPTPAVEHIEETFWNDEASDIVHLTSESFNSFMESHPSVLVMFYAPWCGHCKAMKAAYSEAATLLRDNKIDGVLAAVDATKETRLKDLFNVAGFPTLTYFKQGKVAWDFKERSRDAILEFMKNPQEPPPPPPPEKPWEEQETDVVHLNDENFRFQLKKKKHALVMFYAPWCGHCKVAKPEFTLAASHFHDNSQVMFAAVDCVSDQNRQTCKSQLIEGFPTIKYFSYFKSDEKYLGRRTAADFIGYLDVKVGVDAAPPSVLPPEIELIETSNSINQIVTDIPNYDDDEDDTSDPEGWGFVKELNLGNFRSIMQTVNKTLIMFHSPNCRFCHERKPEFKAAGARINKRRSDVLVAAVNCVEFFEICQEFRVSGYPAFYLFERLNFVDVHHGDPTRDNFIQTLTAHLKQPNVSNSERPAAAVTHNQDRAPSTKPLKTEL